MSPDTKFVDSSVSAGPTASAEAGRAPLPKSYQVRALGRKTLAYQGRQWFTNICCVGCCPFLMVVISALLGAVIQSLVNKSTVPQDVLYCSSVRAQDSLNFPLQDVDRTASVPLPTTPATINGIKLPLSTEDTIAHANFLPAGLSRLASVSSIAGQKQCTQYFGLGYPLTPATVYEEDPQIPAGQQASGYDSTYSSEPLGGWLGPQALSSLSRYLVQYQLRPWLYTTADSGVDPALIGTLPQDPEVPLSNIASLATFAPLASATSATGLLNSIERRLYIDRGTNASQVSGGVQPVPWYEAGSVDNSAAIGNAITSALDRLSRIDKTVLTASNPTDEQVTSFLLVVNNITNSLPYGGLRFQTVNHATKTYKYTMQVGTDARFENAAGFPSQGIRQLLQQSTLHNAMLRLGNITTFGTARLVQSIRSFPQLQNTKIVLPFASFIGRILFPFAISFLVPFFVVVLVTEKEARILVMMRMNGLRAWTYWAAHYVHFFCLHVLSSLVFVIAGRATKMELFTLTSAGVIFLVLFMWGHAQIALSFVMGSMFSRARTGLVVSFLIILCSVLVSLASDTLFVTGSPPSAYFIWPAFAFYRILTVLNQAAYQANSRPYTMSRIKPGDEVFTAIIFLLWEWAFLMLLAVWLGNDGWYKLKKRTAEWFGRLGRGKSMKRQVTDEELGTDPASAPVVAGDTDGMGYMEIEDEDVRAERERIEAMTERRSNPLVLQDLSKTYPSTGKTALKSLTMAVEPDVVFGLLGPNGAGKSTTIGILTGMFPATRGSAHIAGYNLDTDRDGVWRSVGVCPQHDILWDDLTVQEHLLFYARLKGVPPRQEKEVVEESLAAVALNGAFKTRKSKGLSGGEKRRLSIAISLVGNPKVVFLDEPTTGLDPEVRRQIWTIIQQARHGRCIVLTSHSMEEVEVLAQRVGIVSQGRLRCIGTPTHLRGRFANFVRVSLSVADEAQLSRACGFTETVLPEGWTREDDASPVRASYAFSKDAGTIGAVFERMEEGADEAGIEEWGVAEMTLEEVFVNIIGADGEDVSA
ncbi:hypothetical protein HDU87_002241 [Geranomyces variabilis]|uniref:ABC transporter domain-containing protein n=1 Tax=Geranomyces variabilis TaxID=109894 RepID=A0AAD5TLE6_9FUNG|nr:hypothetical protein HDU87_002241 [Geranomyces variabilis]